MGNMKPISFALYADPDHLFLTANYTIEQSRKRALKTFSYKDKDLSGETICGYLYREYYIDIERRKVQIARYYKIFVTVDIQLLSLCHYKFYAVHLSMVSVWPKVMIRLSLMIK